MFIDSQSGLKPSIWAQGCYQMIVKRLDRQEAHALCVTAQQHTHTCGLQPQSTPVASRLVPAPKHTHRRGPPGFRLATVASYPKARALLGPNFGPKAGHAWAPKPGTPWPKAGHSLAQRLHGHCEVISYVIYVFILLAMDMDMDSCI